MRRHRHGRPGWSEVRHGGLGRYVGARLHRRLFLYMGLAIFATFAALAVFFSLTSNGSGPWNNRDTFRDLTGELASAVWSEPVRRDRLADHAARAVGLDIVLVDSEGHTLHRTGANCENPMVEIPVSEPDGGVGLIRACGEQKVSFRVQVWGGIAIAAFILWLMAGAIAHHIGRPLWQLVRVTQQIGAGDLGARARLGRHHTGEVGILAASVNDMASRIEEQIKGQKELLASVSHEIRTPLARLRVLTEMLRDKAADARLVSEAEREIAEIDDLTGQLLAQSRLEFGVLEKREVDCVDLAREALRRVGLDPELVTRREPVIVRGDATLLGRALVNLLQNALVHANGVSRIALEETASEVALWVEDTGPGFSDSDLRSVFRPFVRRSQSSPKSAADAGPGATQSSGSLGLGLSLVERIAAAHGGRAAAKNRPEGGARVGFTVRR